MYLSLNWLKDFIDIPRAISPEELGLKLTMHTVEIDAVEDQAAKYKHIVVGKIKEVKKHPNADKLQLAIVDVGGRDLKIVCGAFNIKAGQLVPAALPGAVLPNGAEINEVAVRGERSEGMLCAEDELGLGRDHSGILILDKKAKISQSLSEYLNLKDVIFEVDNKSITHRPDLWSHYGLAREIAAFLDLKLKALKTKEKLLKPEAEIELDIKVEDSDLCPRYLAAVLDRIKIEPSPKWLRERLIAVGMRPINNIVDITNYVMLELGQPLHAFDRKLVDRIIVRRARKGEVMETLDGEERKLSGDMLVIADSKNPIAVAGIMGGASSEISDDTAEIIIEAANFNFISIRKTSATLSLRTESSMRFEKALDPNLAEAGLKRAVELIKKICPSARVAGEIKDIGKFKLNQDPIELDTAWLNRRLGREIKKEEAVKILNKLGFTVEDKDKIISVIAPSWRATRDITLPEDLLEEIARIYGYDKLGLDMPRVEMRAAPANKELEFIKKVKTALAGAPCLTEVYNYSFVGEDQLKKLGIDYSGHARLANPVASHQTLLRQSLAPGLLNNVKTNQARYDYIAIFEIGMIYLASEGELKKDDKSDGNLPHQEPALAILTAEEDGEEAFNGVKAIINSLFNSFYLDVDYLEAGAAPNWAQGRESADIAVNGENVGGIYKLDDKAGNSLGIKKIVFIAEISLPKFFALTQARPDYKYREGDKYPPAVRDLAFVLNEKILYNNIRREILSFHKLIKSVELFDVYTGEQLGPGNKNMAFRIIYQADRTLTSDEIDEIQTGLIKRMEDKFDAKVRDF